MRGRLVLVALTASLLAGCGGSGSNGEADRTAARILADAKRAARAAGSFSVAGTIEDQGATIGLDLRVADGGGTGTMTIQGSRIDVIRIGRTLYLRAGARFYEQVGAGKAAGRLLDGKWLEVSARAKDFRDLADLTDVDSFLQAALTPAGTIAKGAETTVAGRKAIELKDSKGGSLFVATTGKPYPIEFRGGGTLTLGNWGAPVSPEAPKSPVDLAGLGG
jgi:hypothetical protein